MRSTHLISMHACSLVICSCNAKVEDSLETGEERWLEECSKKVTIEVERLLSLELHGIFLCQILT